jgi:hypothetical protein
MILFVVICRTDTIDRNTHLARQYHNKNLFKDTPVLEIKYSNSMMTFLAAIFRIPVKSGI